MKGLLTTYRNYLPVTPNTPALLLGEGDTPLVHAPAISRVEIELCKIIKGKNPKG